MELSPKAFSVYFMDSYIVYLLHVSRIILLIDYSFCNVIVN